MQLAQFAAQVERYGDIRGYAVQSPGADDDGYLVFLMSIPGRDGEAKLSFNGEMFLLDLRGGYTWPEFGYTDEEAQEAFRDQLALLSAYADPATKEVEVKRRLRRARLELHVSNGAVLRRHGWSKGPDPVEPRATSAHAADRSCRLGSHGSLLERAVRESAETLSARHVGERHGRRRASSKAMSSSVMGPSSLIHTAATPIPPTSITIVRTCRQSAIRSGSDRWRCGPRRR